MLLHLFNPENDLALADGNANYCAPPSAMKIAYDLSSLPLWFAEDDDFVLLADNLHKKYYDVISQTFPLPQIYTSNDADIITKCSPWGWSLQIRRRFENLGFSDNQLQSVESIKLLRELSNRRTTIKILENLATNGVDVPQLPQYITNLDEVEKFICSMPLSVIKAPWSGSGKGIAWGLGRKEIPVEHFAKGVIRRQGGILCEKFLNKVVDFAMEFYCNNGKITFAGYSLFKSTKGVYSGNILASDKDIEEFLDSYKSTTSLLEIKTKIISVLENVFSDFQYEGYFGVDMMIYCDEQNIYRINPCVELNLRMNMGASSRIFYNKFVEKGNIGVFKVEFYKDKGEALKKSSELKIKYPLLFKNGKICSGYMNLSPIDEDTQYSASVIIDVFKNQNSLSSLYNR